MIRHRVVLLAALLAASTAGAAVTTVKPLKTWSGHMPIVIQPLMQSSVTSGADWQRVWATCQMKDSAPEVDFSKRMVLIAVRQSSVVTFSSIKLDQGNLTTSIAVAPDKPNRYTCAFALVDRAGVKTLNGGPIGK
jgi:hypothetical protein